MREALREARSFAYRYDVSLECEFNEHKFYVYGRMTDADLQREEALFMRRFDSTSEGNAVESVIAFEAFPPPNIVAIIEQSSLPFLVEKLDPSAGAGIIELQAKCVWTMSGKRVTITSEAETLIIFISRDVDPIYEDAKKAAIE